MEHYNWILQGILETQIGCYMHWHLILVYDTCLGNYTQQAFCEPYNLIKYKSKQTDDLEFEVMCPGDGFILT